MNHKRRFRRETVADYIELQVEKTNCMGKKGGSMRWWSHFCLSLGGKELYDVERT